MAKNFYEDSVIEDAAGKRPKNYELIARLWSQNPTNPQLVFNFYYTEDYSEVGIETNQPLENFITLPKEVKKVEKIKEKFKI